MVREATLRLGVDARGAKQSLDDFRRSSEQVNVTVQQTTVSTDRLEKKLDLLTVAMRQNARNTAFMADALNRMGQANTRAATTTERTTAAMAKQQGVGSKLGLIFGELATKTAATGGAFLAADFLARVAGATSLMDGLNKVLNSAAAAVRDIGSGQENFLESVTKSAREGATDLDDFVSKLAAARAAAYGTQVFLGGSRQFSQSFVRVPDVGSNQYFLEQLGTAFDQYQREVRENIQSQSRGRGTLYGGSEGIRNRLQATLQSIGREYDQLQANVRAWEAEDKRAMEAATKRAQEWAQALARGAAIQSGRNGQAAAERFGVPLAAPFASAGIQAGQRYAQSQFYASAGTAGSGGGATGNTLLGLAIQSSAQYAGQLAVIAQRQKEVEQSGRRMGESIASAFEDAIFNARSLEEGLELVARAAIRAAFSETVTANLAGSLAGIFGGANATGNVFSAGNVVPFASGGVVGGPVMFPMAGGKRGLMGEAGPEAIMPLGRNAKGELGVKGGGQQINFYISTPDVAGFKRAQRQVAQDARRALRG